MGLLALGTVGCSLWDSASKVVDSDSGSELPVDSVMLKEYFKDGFARIEPGTFMVGSPETETPECRAKYSERQVQVTLTYPYEIAKTEVTQEVWEGAGFPNPSDPQKGPQYPVNYLNYFDTLAFCNRLSEQAGLETCYDLSSCINEPGAGCPEEFQHCGKEHGVFDCECLKVRKYEKMFECKGYRLPTQPEWEQAARAGTATATYAGDLPNPENSYDCVKVDVLEPIAWYCNNSEGKIHPVGKKLPNDWGLFDMLGNVGELADSVPIGLGLAYAETGKEELDPLPLTDPMGASFTDPLDGVHLKGSLYLNVGCRVRIAQILGCPACGSNIVAGFRPVRTLPKN